MHSEYEDIYGDEAQIEAKVDEIRGIISQDRCPKYSSSFGKIYECHHIVYSRCTLFKIDEKGLAVIQQKYDPYNKVTWCHARKDQGTVRKAHRRKEGKA